MVIDTYADVRVARVIHFEEIGSTNEEALGLARAGERGPLWFRADIQTEGRGRLGRPWISSAGNLHVSLLLHDPANSAVLPQLAHVAAVALIGAIRVTIGSVPGLRIKWPNDLVFGTAKVAGILIEATSTLDGRHSCVIGCGINCALAPADLPYSTTALTTIAGRAIRPDDVFAALKPAMADALALWDRGHGYAPIRQAWLDSALPLGTPLILGGGTKPSQRGIFEGIDDEGRLRLGIDGRSLTIEAGDIYLDEGSAPKG